MGKFSASLVKLVPPDEASRKFQRIATTPIQSATDGFLVKDNGIFGQGAKVKVFDRKHNHYGYDEPESIRQYDESEEMTAFHSDIKAWFKAKKKKDVVTEESAFNKLKNKLKAKGESDKEAGGVAYKVGEKKFGKAGMAKKAADGRKKANESIVSKTLDIGDKIANNPIAKKIKNIKNNLLNKGSIAASKLKNARLNRESEDLNELSTKLLSKYVHKAAGDAAQTAYNAGYINAKTGKRQSGTGVLADARGRVKGVRRAVDKIAARSIVEAKIGMVKAIVLEDKVTRDQYIATLLKKAASIGMTVNPSIVPPKEEMRALMDKAEAIANKEVTK